MCVPGFLHVGAEVPVAQHDSLGITGGAGRIDDGRDVHRLGMLRGAVAGVLGPVGPDQLEGADIYDYMKALKSLFAYLGKLLPGDEDGLGVGMRQDVLNLVRGDLWQHRHRDAAVGGDGEERHAPVGHVLRKDGYLVGGIDAEGSQDTGKAVTGLPEAGICIALATVYIVGNGAPGVFGRRIVQYVG